MLCCSLQQHLPTCLRLCLPVSLCRKMWLFLCDFAYVLVLQVHLKSPSSKPVKYQALLLGEDAHFFSLPDGSTVTIPPKYVFTYKMKVTTGFYKKCNVRKHLSKSQSQLLENCNPTSRYSGQSSNLLIR